MVVTGIDVSKAMLDVAIGDGPVHRFANSGPGLRGWSTSDPPAQKAPALVDELEVRHYADTVVDHPSDAGY